MRYFASLGLFDTFYTSSLLSQQSGVRELVCPACTSLSLSHQSLQFSPLQDLDTGVLGEGPGAGNDLEALGQDLFETSSSLVSGPGPGTSGYTTVPSPGGPMLTQQTQTGAKLSSGPPSQPPPSPAPTPSPSPTPSLPSPVSQQTPTTLGLTITEKSKPSKFSIDSLIGQ